MKLGFIFSLLLTGSVSFLGAATVAPADLAPELNTSELVITSYINAEDEVCYSATVAVDVGPVSADVEVSACGATAEEAWDDFQDALLEPFK